MTIGAINYFNQSFKGQNAEHKRSFMGDVSEVLDSTAGFMKIARNAIDTPEEASVKVLTNQIDNVAKSDKTPAWVKSGLKYISAGLTAGITGYAVYRTPGGIKSLLSKCKLGRSALNFVSTAKDTTLGLLKKFKFDSKILSSAKEKVLNGYETAKAFVVKKFPKFPSIVKSVKEGLHTDKWTKSGATKGVIASTLGFSSGKKVIDKYDDNIIKSKSNDNADDIMEVDEAAY